MPIKLPRTVGGPRLCLLDADAEGWDLSQLRGYARRLGAEQRAAHVSRSYSFPYALVAWHRAAVGVDIERVVACDERFGRSICTPEEAAMMPWRSDAQIISLWSGKEALAKALGDALQYDPRRLSSPATWPEGVCGRWRAAPVPVPPGHCAWACWRAAAPE